MDGNRIWFFPDGDLPPPGDIEPKGHESLLILNPNGADAEVTLTIYFEDQPAVKATGFTIGAERVRCVRLDEAIGAEAFRIPLGQYALKATSNEPVICQLGRMDVRQPNLAYYTVMGVPGGRGEDA